MKISMPVWWGWLLRVSQKCIIDPRLLLQKVQKKHAAHAITADVSLGETAETVEFMGADCVIVTGSATGKPPAIADVQEAKSHCGLPVFLGSGITANNIAEFYETADGFIIGTAFKIDGLWSNGVDPQRVANLLNTIKAH